MTAPSIVPYILLFASRRLTPAELRDHPEAILQNAQIIRFAKSNRSQVLEVIIDQTTNRKSRFWLRPAFRRAVEIASETSSSIVVGDLVNLLKGIPVDRIQKAWKALHEEYPELHSGLHLEKLGTGARIKADLDQVLFKRSIRKKRATTRSPIQPSEPTSRAGGAGTRSRSNAFAKTLAPILRKILEANPKAGPASIAHVLNEKGIASASGGHWHASSASNLLSRCRALKLV